MRLWLGTSLVRYLLAASVHCACWLGPATVFAVTVGQIGQPSRTGGLAEAATIIANARKVLSPSGVERLQTVRIGDIDQWVSIRGRDTRNPLLLVINGGPGYVLMPESWWISCDWDEYFTVVHWDQRGQMADMPESERRGWTFAMDAARRSGNAEAIHQLQSIAPYFALLASRSLRYPRMLTAILVAHGRV